MLHYLKDSYLYFHRSYRYHQTFLGMNISLAEKLGHLIGQIFNGVAAGLSYTGLYSIAMCHCAYHIFEYFCLKGDGIPRRTRYVRQIFTDLDLNIYSARNTPNTKFFDNGLGVLSTLSTVIKACMKFWSLSRPSPAAAARDSRRPDVEAMRQEARERHGIGSSSQLDSAVAASDSRRPVDVTALRQEARESHGIGSSSQLDSAAAASDSRRPVDVTALRQGARESHGIGSSSQLDSAAAASASRRPVDVTALRQEARERHGIGSSSQPVSASAARDSQSPDVEALRQEARERHGIGPSSQLDSTAAARASQRPVDFAALRQNKRNEKGIAKKKKGFSK